MFNFPHTDSHAALQDINILGRHAHRPVLRAPARKRKGSVKNTLLTLVSAAALSLTLAQPASAIELTPSAPGLPPNDVDAFNGTVNPNCTGQTPIGEAESNGRIGNIVSGAEHCIGDNSQGNVVSGLTNTVGAGSNHNLVSGNNNELGDDNQDNAVSGESNRLGDYSESNTVSGQSNFLGNGLGELSGTISNEVTNITLNIGPSTTEGNILGGTGNAIGAARTAGADGVIGTLDDEFLTQIEPFPGGTLVFGAGSDNLVTGRFNTLSFNSSNNFVSGQSNFIGGNDPDREPDREAGAPTPATGGNILGGTGNAIGGVRGAGADGELGTLDDEFFARTAGNHNLVSGNYNTLGQDSDSNAVSGQNNTLGDYSDSNAVSGQNNTLGNFSDSNAVSGSGNSLGSTNFGNAVSGVSNFVGNGGGNSGPSQGNNVSGTGNAIGATRAAGADGVLGTEDDVITASGYAGDDNFVTGSFNTLGVSSSNNAVSGVDNSLGGGSFNNTVGGVLNDLNIGNNGNTVSGFQNGLGLNNRFNVVSGTSNDIGNLNTYNIVSGVDNALGNNNGENAVSGRVNRLGNDNDSNTVGGALNALGNSNVGNAVNGARNSLGDFVENSIIGGSNNQIAGGEAPDEDLSRGSQVGSIVFENQDLSAGSQSGIVVLGSDNDINSEGEAGSHVTSIGFRNRVNGAASGFNTIIGHNGTVQGTGNFLAGGNETSGPSATGDNNVVIGAGARSTVDNGVAIGAGSSATLSQEAAQDAFDGVTIGSVTLTEVTDATGGEFAVGNRLVTGVADGRIVAGSNDAVNGNQLFQTTTALDSRITTNTNAIADINVNADAIGTNTDNISDLSLIHI